MLRTLFILFSILFTTVLAIAQVKVDTVYFYKDTETIKDSADEYRVRTWGDTLKAYDYSITYGSISSSSYYSSFDPYVRDGHTINYVKGVIDSEGDYVNDEAEGLWKNYYNTGELWYTTEYKAGSKNGFLRSYYKTGEVKRVEEYEEGSLKNGTCYTRAGADTAFYDMFIMPEFPGGGDASMMKYIKSTIVYPKQARKERIQGTVYVQYTIFEDGSVQNVAVVPGKGVHPLLDEAAVACIKDLPKWTPGYLDGIPVKVKRVARIAFKMEN